MDLHAGEFDLTSADEDEQEENEYKVFLSLHERYQQIDKRLVRGSNGIVQRTTKHNY